VTEELLASKAYGRIDPERERVGEHCSEAGADNKGEGMARISQVEPHRAYGWEHACAELSAGHPPSMTDHAPHHPYLFGGPFPNRAGPPSNRLSKKSALDFSNVPTRLPAARRRMTSRIREERKVLL